MAWTIAFVGMMQVLRVRVNDSQALSIRQYVIKTRVHQSAPWFDAEYNSAKLTTRCLEKAFQKAETSTIGIGRVEKSVRCPALAVSRKLLKVLVGRN